MTPFDAAVITVSDGVSRGTREDESGVALVGLLQEAGYRITHTEVVPDEETDVVGALRRAAGRAQLILTTGGTGFGLHSCSVFSSSRAARWWQSLPFC